VEEIISKLRGPPPGRKISIINVSPVGDFQRLN
jgi:hypothetical protein